MRPLVVLILILVLIALVAVGIILLVSNRPVSSPATPPPTTAAPVPSTEPTPTKPDRSATAHHQHVAYRPTHRTRQLQVLEKPHFIIGYDNQAKNPAWVTYELDGPIAFPGQEPTRPATFETDFATSAHVSQRDYTSSGYDRGHMCPAYAQWSRFGAEAFKQTFICSNIIPQLHVVNAGIWEDLEVEIAGRSGHGGGWAEKYGHVTVINGPVYEANPERLHTGVTIPAACFSIILEGSRAIAFEIPNVAGTKGPLTRWITTIKKIEDDTGLDVFAGEAASERERLESVRADRLW